MNSSLTAEPSITLNHVIDLLDKFPPPDNRWCLASPTGYLKLRQQGLADQHSQGYLASIRIEVAIWMRPDEFALASPKAVELLRDINEHYGPDCARFLFDRIVQQTNQDQKRATSLTRQLGR